MRQAIHIFLKDSRQQRYPMALLLAWTAALLADGVSADPVFHRPIAVFQFLASDLSAIVWLVGAWFLTAQVLHADALPGTRQFWLTRPYRRTSLLGAKALFVVAYISAPLLFAQTIVLVAQGFPLAGSLPALVWNQLLILGLVVLPAAALAAVTSRLAQFALVALLSTPVLLQAEYAMSPWAALEWIRHSVAALAIVVTCVIVLALQFSRRLTSVSRIIALTSLLILIVALPRSSWRTAFAWQAALAPPDQPLSAELARPEATFAASPDRIHQIRMAFRILGPPPGTPIMCDGAEVTLETPSGPWNTGLQGAHAGTRSRVDEGCHVVIAAPPAQMREIWDRPVTVHATIYVTMLGPERAVSIPTDGSLAAVQNVGVCRGIVVEEPLAPAPRQPEAYVGCQTALREPRSVMEISTNHRTEPLSIGRLSYSPFPAALTLQPVRTFGFHRFPAADVATLAAREAAGHARLVVDVANVRLAELAQ